MRRRWKVLSAVIGVVALLSVGVLIYARPLLLTATGYAAHNACAVRMVAGRDAQAPAADLPDNPLVPLLRTTVHVSEGTARSSLLGMFGQTAFHRTGLGCTLADDRPQLEAPRPVAEGAEAAWPGSGNDDGAAGQAALEAALDGAFAEDDAQGRVRGTRAVVVVHRGQIVAERYAEGFDADTPQLGWSMTKSVTNAMVGRLVAEGRLDVSEDHLLDTWTDARAGITLDDLLHMTSGLAWDETYDLGTAITEMLYLRSDMGAFAADQPLAHDIGSHQQYSSGTTNIICDILHQRTGLGPEMAHELVFRPLGMSSAVLEPDAAGDLVCSSYLWATPRDWARFGLWFLQDGRWEGEQLLPADWVRYSTSAPEVAGEDPGHAAHWWANEGPDGSLAMPDVPADTFWASGHDGQRVFISPSADLVVVRMGFTPTIPAAELGHERLLTALIDALDALDR